MSDSLKDQPEPSADGEAIVPVNQVSPMDGRRLLPADAPVANDAHDRMAEENSALEVVSETPARDTLCNHNPLPEEWPEGVSHRKGAKKLLRGIDVYYDFQWKAVLGSGKTVFATGKELASKVLEICPDGKTPALLLTNNAGAKAGFRTTDTHFVVVVYITGYLSEPSRQGAAYLLSFVTNIELLQKVENEPELLTQLLDKHTTVSGIVEWLDKHPDHLPELQRFINERYEIDVTEHVNCDSTAPDEPLTNNTSLAGIDEWLAVDHARIARVQELIDSKRREFETSQEAFDRVLKAWSVNGINEPDISKLVSAIDKDQKLGHLIAAMAENVDKLKRLPRVGKDDGRRMVAAALRASHRADAVETLKKLIEADVLEQKFQELFEENWWMLGSQYIARFPERHLTAKEKYDLLLISADNYCDLIELKRSRCADIVVSDHGKWVVSAEVNRVVNQVAHYISQHEKDRGSILIDHNIDLYKTCAFVVIGYIGETDAERDVKRRAIRMYNSHLHRIRVLTYDEVVRIAESVVSCNSGEVDYAAQLARSGGTHNSE